MTLLRLVFAWQNASFFETIGFEAFIFGAYFDAVTIALLAMPYALLSFPNPWKANKYLQFVSKFYLYLISVFILTLNCWDIAYFSYTQKRSSLSYFLHLLTGTETSSLAGEFLMEFWWLPLLFVALLYGFVKTMRRPVNLLQAKSWNAWLRYGIIVIFTFVIARGSFSLRPLSIIDASALTSLSEATLVLNTAVTVMKSLHFETTQKLNFFNETELKQYLPGPDITNHAILPKGTNVVVIMLESFGTAYAGPNSPMSYSPFLDSLLNKSLYLDKAIANGRTSMDAVPAILAGMPSWLNESYILSPYCTNQIDALPTVFGKNGYHTSFFHGAKTGSMNFDDFTKSIGIQHYYGMEDYKGPEAFDGNWGIWDHQMFSFFAKELSTFQEPFVSTFFSLSSHHPYKTPVAYRNRVKKGPEKLCATISYADMALASFFKKAARQKWYDHTLFVLCADHVGPTRLSSNQSLVMRYRIPIGFFHPKIDLKAKLIDQINPKQVFQQIDIFPTILDLFGLGQKAFTFGTSIINKSQGAKVVYEDGYLISYENKNGQFDVFAWNPNVKEKSSSRKNFGLRSNLLLATYQDYQNRLLENRCRKAK
ncbi:MAG: LTA synthase family protein [Flavobacteriales bacterium]